MKSLSLTLILFFATPALSQQVCSDVESHPESREVMSGSEWLSLEEEWASEEPRNPGYLNLLWAYSVYSSEKDNANRLRGDKRKHCYMGCQIARRISLETAVYVAWLKEYEDLTDCDPRTYFEWRDYQVTVDGAEAGVAMGASGRCLDHCQNQPRR